MLAGLVRSKVTAVTLGPAGMGMSGELLQYLSLVNVPVTVLVGQALVREMTSSARGEAGLEPPAALNAAASWSVAIAVVLSLTATLAAPIYLGGGVQTQLWLALAALGALATGLLGIPTTALATSGLLGHAARVQVVASVTAATLVSILTWHFGLQGLFVALAIAPIIVLPWATTLASRTLDSPPWSPTGILNPGYLQRAFAMGAYAGLGGLTYQAALFSVRLTLDHTGGPELNGQFQASWGIGSVYFGAILTGIGSYAFPRYAAAKNADELRGHVRDAELFVSKYAPPLVMLAFSLREPVLTVLYSNKFGAASEILGWQLIGDLAKALSWVYAGPLMLRGHYRAALVIEVLAACGLSGFTAVLAPVLGPKGVGLAYLASYALYLPLTVIALRLATGVNAQPRMLAQTAGVTCVLACFAHMFDTSVAGRCVLVLVALVWLQRAGFYSALVSQVRARLVRPSK